LIHEARFYVWKGKTIGKGYNTKKIVLPRRLPNWQWPEKVDIYYEGDDLVIEPGTSRPVALRYNSAIISYRDVRPEFAGKRFPISVEGKKLSILLDMARTKQHNSGKKISYTLPLELYAEIERLALRFGISRAQLIRNMLMEKMEELCGYY